MTGIRRYNASMSAAPKRRLEKSAHRRHPAPHTYAAETTGLLVIALLILILMLARYWHSIHWSLR
jgi:hypothetical protein